MVATWKTNWVWILFFTLSQTLRATTPTIFLPEYRDILVHGIRQMDNANKSETVEKIDEWIHYGTSTNEKPSRSVKVSFCFQGLWLRAYGLGFPVSEPKFIDEIGRLLCSSVKPAQLHWVLKFGFSNCSLSKPPSSFWWWICVCINTFFVVYEPAIPALVVTVLGLAKGFPFPLLPYSGLF